MANHSFSDTAGTGIISADILLPGEQNTIQSLTHEIHTFDFLIQRIYRSIFPLWIIFP
jgi:hypothetical protein